MLLSSRQAVAAIGHAGIGIFLSSHNVLPSAACRGALCLLGLHVVSSGENRSCMGIC